jgi:hypothetical protein
MRGYSIMSDEERQNIISQHKSFYNGYAVGNVPSNMTPLTVYDAAQDKGGVNVNNRGEVSQYANHKINEAKVEKDLVDEIDMGRYNDEIDMDKEFDGHEMMRGERRAYDFDSDGGNVDVYGESIIRESDESLMDLVKRIMLSRKFDIIANEMKSMDFSDEFEFADNFISYLLNDYVDEEYYDNLYDLVKDEYGEIILSMYGRSDDFDSDGGNVDVYGESKISEKESAWEKFQKDKHVTDKTIKVARNDFEKMWDSVNEEEETEAMCEQCGLSEAMCECGMYEEIDEDLQESFKTQKDRITEMFNRFKNYN